MKTIDHDGFILGMIAGVSLLYVSCDRDLNRHDGFKPGEMSTESAQPPSPDVGTGTGAEDGVKEGSSSRTDYKPSTGPGGRGEEQPGVERDDSGKD